jgi:eukaryotic-like serine/threonine-protein kinase
MAGVSHCVECSSPLPENWPKGLCSRCALESALNVERDDGEVVDSHKPADGGTLPKLTETSGTRIGRYKLLEQIGEGGFGVVWMAEQEEPVRRRVALKIIKLGMDTKQVIARFEAERQALAMMDHANIAKVLDAGATDSGRPYFVMELVRGIKITEYCDQNQLSTRERLDLFVKVCQAIQHAHQKGIIHRDIKPSNVLVALHDTVPTPKMIDFGIAKATDGRLTDKTLFTSFQQFIGTPAYMSPEQAAMMNLDVDTRSDIYSLGVLLYELLTGKTPFEARELVHAGLDEVRRIIREKEPLTPSTRLTMMVKDELTTTAKQRQTDAPRLIHSVRGDLDWIVMKCLEKDRTRRYETASGLASDIERHVNNETVLACPPSKLHRLKKLMRRNKLTFAAGSAVAVSLVIGLTLSAVLFFRERAAREQAKQQESVAQAVNEFLLQDLLRQADSRSQAEARFTPDPGLTVREALERAAGRIEERFKEQPLEEAAVRLAIGEALRGVGEAERAIEHLKRALALRRAQLGTDHPDTLTCMDSLAVTYQAAGKSSQALPLFEETLKLRKVRLGSEHPQTLTSRNNLAAAYLEANKRDEALLLFEETLRVSKAKLGPEHPDTLTCMDSVARGYQNAGELEKALPLFEETLRLRRARLGPDHPDTLASMDNLALAYRDAGKLEEAVRLSGEALKQRRAKLGVDHPETLTSMHNLAWAYLQVGKLEQALLLSEETLKLKKAKLGPEHPNTLASMHDLALTYQAAGKLEQALPLLEETLKLTKAKAGPEHPATLNSMGALAFAYHAAGKLEQALPLAEETLKLTKAKMGPEHPDTLVSMAALALVYQAAGKLDEAVRLSEETLKLRKAKLGLDHPETLVSINNLALAYLVAGDFERALPMLEETLKVSKAKLGPNHPDTLSTMENLAGAYEDAGRLELALPLFEETLKLTKAQQGPDHPDTLSSMSSLAAAYRAAEKLDQALPLSEETLKLSKSKLGPEHPRTLISMWNLALVHQAAGKLEQALPLLEETLRLQKATLGPDHPDALTTMASVGRALLQQSNYARAEPLLSECLDLRKTKTPDDWRTFDVMAMRGAALLGQQKYAKAESSLVSGYRGMDQRRDRIPAAGKRRLKEHLQRLVDLYESTSRPKEAADWRKKIDAFGAEEAANKAGLPLPGTAK